MGQSTNKDELVQFLRNGLAEEFNQARACEDGVKLDLIEIDLRDVKLTGVNLSKADITGSDFSKAEIEESNFSESDLTSVNFSHSTIVNTDFSNIVLEGSLFSYANIQDCDFEAADFNGVNICGADLSGTDLSLTKNLMQSVYDGETVWPDDDLLPDDFEPEEDLSFAELEEAKEFPEDEYSY